MPSLRRYVLQEIKTDGIVQIGWVEIYDIVGSPERDLIQDFFGQIAVGINDPHTVAVFDVLENQIAKKCRFSGAALTDAVHMLPPIGRKKAKGNRLAPGLPVTDVIYRLTIFEYVKVIAFHSRPSPRSGRSGA